MWETGVTEPALSALLAEVGNVDSLQVSFVVRWGRVPEGEALEPLNRAKRLLAPRMARNATWRVKHLCVAAGGGRGPRARYESARPVPPSGHLDAAG